MKKQLLLFLLLASCSTPHKYLHDSLDESLKIIYEQYPGEIDSEKLRQGMLQGLFIATSPFASYLNEIRLKAFLDAVDGSDLKLGMLVEKHDKGMLVKKVYKDSPSHKSGITENDIIIEFDCFSLKGLGLLEFIKLIKEKKSYTLKFLHKDKIHEAKITPGPFIPPSIELKWHGNVACIKIGFLTKNSAKEFIENLNTIKSTPKATGIILDLRDCPGGSFESGLAIAGQFLNKKIVMEKQNAKNVEKYYSEPIDVSCKLPIIVLQGNNTYSAGEIISAALKGNKAATVIGQNTGGCALVKSIEPFKSQRDGYIIPIAFINDPSGNRIDSKGVEPDITIKDAKNSKDKRIDFYILEALKFLKSRSNNQGSSR